MSRWRLLFCEVSHVSVDAGEAAGNLLRSESGTTDVVEDKRLRITRHLILSSFLFLHCDS
ncbi:unnamed protein product [Ixodes persulcatus]